MNKKRLMALPVVCVVVAMIGASVMAAGSAQKNFKVTDESGTDITVDYSGDAFDAGSTKLADLGLSGLEDDVKAANSEAKIEDAEIVAAYMITEDVSHTGKKTVEILGVSGNASDVFVTVHKDSQGNFEYAIGTSIQVSSVSPFVVYKIAVNSSAQTGEYATPYIAMISVALLACGAVFAVRAKKATK